MFLVPTYRLKANNNHRPLSSTIWRETNRNKQHDFIGTVAAHFWDSASNSNPKTGSRLIFRIQQKPNKAMFGVVSSCLLSPSMVPTRQRLFTASGARQPHPLYNVKVFSCLSYIPYFTNENSFGHWPSYNKWHNPRNKNPPPSEPRVWKY